MAAFVMIAVLLFFRFTFGQDILSSPSKNCALSQIDGKLLGLSKEVMRINKNNENLQSNVKNAYQNIENSMEELRQKVDAQNSQLTLIDGRYEKQRRDDSLKYEQALDDFRRQMRDLQIELFNLTEVTKNLKDYVRFFTGSVDIGYILIHGNTSFLISKHELSWSDSWSFCRARDAMLAHVKDSNVNDFLLKSLLKENDDFWIGGENVSGTFQWKNATGHEPITWSNWAPGEPNRSDQKCIQLWKSKDLKWDNHECWYKKRFICAKFLFEI